MKAVQKTAFEGCRIIVGDAGMPADTDIGDKVLAAHALKTDIQNKMLELGQLEADIIKVVRPHMDQMKSGTGHVSFSGVTATVRNNDNLVLNEEDAAALKRILKDRFDDLVKTKHRSQAGAWERARSRSQGTSEQPTTINQQPTMKGISACT